MQEIEDEVLIEEIKRRIEEKNNALRELTVVTGKLETLNDKLRQSEALKSNFLSNIRHEINNPLAVILGISKRLVNGNAGPKDTEIMGEMIYKEAFALDFQLKNIYMAAEIEAGELSIGVSHTDVGAMVCSLVDSFKQMAADKNIHVEYVPEWVEPGEKLYFDTDPEKLSCILANLLANAIEYSEVGGNVLIRAGKKITRLVISVADDGIGIAEKDRNRIFDRFIQLDTGTCKKYKGHGLGLSITKALAEMLAGEITLISSPGNGCTFTVILDEFYTAGLGDDLSEDGNERIFGGAEKY